MIVHLGWFDPSNLDKFQVLTCCGSTDVPMIVTEELEDVTCQKCIAWRGLDKAFEAFVSRTICFSGGDDSRG